MSFRRRDLGAGSFALVSTAMEEIGVLAAFTERPGGRSRKPFASLNLSYSTGDDAEHVRANRDLLLRGLGVPPFAVAGLVHGAEVKRIGPERAGAGFNSPGEAIAGADGLSTASLDLPMAVTWADCVPVVLASVAEPTVAVVHAGWRGIAAGVVSNALAPFGDTGAVLAAIGPAIGPCHYEVGEEVALAVAAASGVGGATERREGLLFLDLVAAIGGILASEGVATVHDTGLCTACHPERFYSHRRDGRTGRQGAVAMRARPAS
jgi:YfiH family protein